MPQIAGAAERDDSIYRSAGQYKDEALTLLGHLVNIDSGTGDTAGINAAAAIVTQELKAMGARVETSPNTIGEGENYVATLTGSGKTRLLLIAHLDTVFASGTAKARPFRIANGRAYGPGVADDKSGVVVVLYALKVLRDLGFKDYGQISVILNSNEETGSFGSRALIETLAKNHDIALNFEPGRPADGLVTWRKGSGTITIEVKGRAAHAGIEPEKGRNAAVELANQVFQLDDLARLGRGTTVNVTVLKAGDRTNVIPDQAMAIADVRAQTPEEFDRIERELPNIEKRTLVLNTQVTAKLTRAFPVMLQNEKTTGLAAKAQSIYAELGKSLSLEGSGGAADSSFTAGVSTPTLDGFGLVGGNNHAPEEYVEVDSIVPRLYLTARLLMELGPGK